MDIHANLVDRSHEDILKKLIEDTEKSLNSITPNLPTHPEFMRHIQISRWISDPLRCSYYFDGELFMDTRISVEGNSISYYVKIYRFWEKTL